MKDLSKSFVKLTVQAYAKDKFMVSWFNPPKTKFHYITVDTEAAQKILMGPCFGMARWAAELFTETNF
jgi:hypothetical protein